MLVFLAIFVASYMFLSYVIAPQKIADCIRTAAVSFFFACSMTLALTALTLLQFIMSPAKRWIFWLVASFLYFCALKYVYRKQLKPFIERLLKQRTCRN